nr:tryptophan 2-halogenase-like [Nerophis lumbriciformis]
MTAAVPLHDVVVIGGGPAGAVTARQLALAGLDVTVLERQRMPRFQIGESLLPRSFDQLAELGLAEGLEQVPSVVKRGGEFVMGHGLDQPSWARFRQALEGTGEAAINVARAPFDEFLLQAARQAGAQVEEGSAVRSLERLEEGRVELTTTAPEGQPRQLRARWLIDASGQAAVVGRHLGSRQALPRPRRVAYFGHFRGVRRHSGEEGGYVSIVICKEGWFWLIPLDDEHTSIGLVIEEAAAKRSKVAAREMLAWGIERCPVVAERCREAAFVGAAGVRADFSYTCRPFAGPGYFLVGDAATFVDPIFSTGVCLGMMSGAEAADHLARILRDGEPAGPLLRKYRRFVDGSSGVFFRLVDQFYDPAFRDLFLSEEGPFGVHRAISSVLAGDIYPRPRWALRWRLALMEVFIALQRRIALVPRRREHSLFAGAAADSLSAAAPRMDQQPPPVATV